MWGSAVHGDTSWGRMLREGEGAVSLTHAARLQVALNGSVSDSSVRGRCQRPALSHPPRTGAGCVTQVRCVTQVGPLGAGTARDKDPADAFRELPTVPQTGSEGAPMLCVSPPPAELPEARPVHSPRWQEGAPESRLLGTHTKRRALGLPGRSPAGLSRQHHPRGRARPGTSQGAQKAHELKNPATGGNECAAGPSKRPDYAAFPAKDRRRK